MQDSPYYPIGFFRKWPHYFAKNYVTWFNLVFDKKLPKFNPDIGRVVRIVCPTMTDQIKSDHIK